MTKRLFTHNSLALIALLIAALALSACGANLSGEPEIESEMEIITIPTKAPTQPPAAASDTDADADEAGADDPGTADDSASAAPSDTNSTTLVQGDYDLGFEVYLRECAQCHGAADGVGPGLKTMTDSVAARVDGMSGAEYVRQSILEPGAYIVEGYSDIMPANYSAILTDEELAGLVTFVLEFDPARMGMGGNTDGTGPGSGPDTSADTSSDSSGSTAGDASASGNPEPAATSENAVGPALETENTLTVTGSLVAGTADGEPIPAGLPVKLYAIDPHGNLAGMYDTTSTEDQHFAFENVARTGGMTYFLEVQYDDVPQGARIASIEGTEDEVSTDVTLYERTTETDSVVINWAEMLINYAPIEQAGLEVWLDIELANTGDRIVTTDERSDVTDWYVSVEIELPVAAFGIQPMQAENSQRYTVDMVDGVPVVKDTWPLRPGQAHTITLAYYVPYDNGAVIEHGFNYQVLDGIVLMPNDTVDFSSEQFDPEGDWRGRVAHSGVSVEALEPGESIDPENDFTLVKAHELLDPIAPDERMVFELDGRPTRTLDLMNPNPASTSSNGDGDDNTLAIALGVLGFGVILLAGVLYWRQRAATSVPQSDDRKPVPAGWRPPGANASKEELLAAMAALDDLYETDAIDEETYLERRAILTERLLPMLDDEA